MYSLGEIIGRTFCFPMWRTRRAVLTPLLGKLRQKVRASPEVMGP